MAKKATNPGGEHNGHRRRIMIKYREQGMRCLTERERLEMLLYPMLTRVDTGYIADGLLERFGSLDDVLNADCSELAEVDGVGECLALQLALLGEIRKTICRAFGSDAM